MTSLPVQAAQAYAKAMTLRVKCELAFDDDPNTEVGKVIGAPGESFFFVYVMKGDSAFRSRTMDRANIVVVSDKGVEIHGPDESAIGQVLQGLP
jgi:hypothetical protein